MSAVGMRLLAASALIAAATLGSRAEAAEGPSDASPADGKSRVDFAREVRPILSDACFACHGFDEKERKAGLRLDTHEGAFGKLESGDAAVVPGDLENSGLVFRIETDDEDMLMPPKDSGKSLTPEQVDVLKRWVAEGASWSGHWAFEPPIKAEAPKTADATWARDPIDSFLLARIEAAGLKPSAPADPTTLLRRASLDLTGLPPTPGEVDGFLAAVAATGLDAAYEKAVDRLLESPRYGEHMARYWLDAARYGDTHGLHLDNFREMWPYRDWVVKAFNDDKPFDAFIVEQLAGDLLPNPTPDQLVATGFNRCHVSTAEGGSIDQEVYTRNVSDQVDTNGSVFLGLTVACARCHDHKYDPITQKEYYQFFAFFNNIDGPAMDGNKSRWEPFLKTPTPQQVEALAKADARIAELKAKADAESARFAASYDPKLDDGLSEVVVRGDYTWIDDEFPPGAAASGTGEFAAAPDHPVKAGRAALRIEAAGLTQKVVEAAGPKLKVGKGDAFYAHVFLDPKNPPREVMLQWKIGGQWAKRAFWGENLIDWGKDATTERLRLGDLPADGEWARLEIPAAKLEIAPGAVIEGWAFTLFDGVAYFDESGLRTTTPQEGQSYDNLTAWVRARLADDGAGLADPVKAIVKKPRAQRTEAERKQLLDLFLADGWAEARKVVQPIRDEIARAEAEKKAIDDAVSTTLIFRERPGDPKPAFVLNRGEYDQPKDQVGRIVPAFLPPLPSDASADRLGLARWLVAPEHPLTARVAVNRFWQQLFGTGLVKTSEDFGAQGEPPSHPELLDWLSVTFREEGWDVKRLMKRLATTAAYRQTSKATPEGLARDPDNRLLARGPRFRLDAETLRDQAFFTAGVLVEKMGGPSVKPPQPSGLWEAVAYVGSDTGIFKADEGVDKVHRRSLYTFWKRTAPPPQMSTFDAPSRESCQVRRERTNTPLQALLLLNEPQYVEASRALAERALREGGSTTEERLAFMFRVATARTPDPADLAELSAALKDFSAHYADRPDDARALIEGGATRPDPALAPVDLAPWTMIGNIILNLDEVITRG
ncbi:PSD1 and planctomycete cytochrome C domain-containing protein [Planctomyces sp. SH-PL62]|uniref:PSD1 and planctomycete cytochrome C domain-containing protein n=1 Tax=Planctomyces sp. SH-PL62 TaxID=1636152 RepID=UPI00078E6E24|nr:PSD1 and planctomycete cytochrome C domain-containing protein [Planctomyces sp. SH-PL62]AMV40671.1 Planctomycete cytochrome C [Planctomyces sp. SH-PL62]